MRLIVQLLLMGFVMIALFAAYTIGIHEGRVAFMRDYQAQCEPIFKYSNSEYTIWKCNHNSQRQS